MTPEEIRTKSLELAAFYTAKGNGKILQVKHSDGWTDKHDEYGPTMQSDVSKWRVKPEPRRMWETHNSYARTYDQNDADDWKRQGLTVTEWQEVLP